MRRGRGPRPLTLRPLHPAQVAHLERGGGHAARTRHYLYGKPAYCKLPHEVGMDAGFEARLQKLCLAQKADFKVVARMPPEYRAGKLRTLSLARNELQLWVRGAWSPEVC